MFNRLFFFMLLCVQCIPAQALEFNLSIQPVLPKKEIIRAYQPLADYLSDQIGHKVIIKAHNNFLTYWASMKRNRGFDLVLDAAHFTDFRAQKNGFEVLAKIPDTVSFSIVTHEDNLVFDTDELVLKKIATLVSPSVGALRIRELFSDPMRQPRVIYADDSNQAAQMVMDGKVDAAIIPTALVSRFEGLNTVETTESLPHMAFSASSNVPRGVRESIKQALISAVESASGQAMLARINFPAFESTSGQNYRGYEKMLSNMIGYR